MTIERENHSFSSFNARHHSLSLFLLAFFVLAVHQAYPTDQEWRCSSFVEMSFADYLGAFVCVVCSSNDLKMKHQIIRCANKRCIYQAIAISDERLGRTLNKYFVHRQDQALAFSEVHRMEFYHSREDPRRMFGK